MPEFFAPASALPLRVAHVVRPAQGGMVTQVRTLIAAMPDVHAQVAASASVLQGLQRAIDGGDLTLPGRLSPLDALFRGGRQVGDWARRQNADLLHGHGVRWAMLFWAASRRAGIPYVLTLHNLLPKTNRVARAALGFFLAKASRLIAVSEAVARSARALLGANAKVTTIYNGIDFRPFDAPKAADRAATRARLSVSEDAPVALSVARLSPEKNIGAFVEAAAQIAVDGKLPQARFFVAGDGPERASLEARIAALGLRERCILLGMRDDVPALMNAADVVCVPSGEEGFGLVALEAMAAGCPVVATPVGGLPELIVDGKTGMLTRDTGPVHVAEALATLFADPQRARAMGAAGRIRAYAHYGAASMAAATRAVYVEVTGR